MFLPCLFAKHIGYAAISENTPELEGVTLCKTAMQRQETLCNEF